MTSQNTLSNGVMPEAKLDRITVIHFNDVYNVESREVEPVGGAPRFLTAVNNVRKDCDPLILFSGDIFAPSISKFCSVFFTLLPTHF